MHGIRGSGREFQEWLDYKDIYEVSVLREQGRKEEEGVGCSCLFPHLPNWKISWSVRIEHSIIGL